MEFLSQNISWNSVFRIYFNAQKKKTFTLSRLFHSNTWCLNQSQNLSNVMFKFPFIICKWVIVAIKQFIIGFFLICYLFSIFQYRSYYFWRVYYFSGFKEKFYRFYNNHIWSLLKLRLPFQRKTNLIYFCK